MTGGGGSTSSWGGTVGTGGVGGSNGCMPGPAASPEAVRWGLVPASSSRISLLPSLSRAAFNVRLLALPGIPEGPSNVLRLLCSLCSSILLPWSEAEVKLDASFLPAHQPFDNRCHM